MNNVFVDTSFFKAQIDNKDDFHEKAQLILQGLEKSNITLITSNYVLDETYTVIRVKCNKELVRDFLRVLDEFETGMKIIRVVSGDEEKAWNWFWNDWSKLSFTDCVSFAIMKKLGIQRVAAFDSHFERAGFDVVK